MTTFSKRLAANRANAQLSTGPRTPEGKARVSQNGVTHGLTGRFSLLPCESLDSLDKLTTQLTREHRPQSQTETFLVRQLAELQLRLDRAAALESALMAAAADPSLRPATPLARLARAFLKGSTFDAALLRLNRYENALRRGYLQTLAELRRQQKSRPAEVVQSVAESLPQLIDNTNQYPSSRPDKPNPLPPASARSALPALPLDAVPGNV